LPVIVVFVEFFQLQLFKPFFFQLFKFVPEFLEFLKPELFVFFQLLPILKLQL
jgi:hypothetical protein